MSTLSGSTAVIVLGMHRSGTSALSSVLATSGYNMGKRLFGPQAGVNERGFFENSGAVGINERLLDALATQWDQPAFLPNVDTMREDPELRERLHRFLNAHYLGSTLWGLKDPRVSILEPLWTEAIKRSGANLRCILIVRNPFEVADSLHRRDRFPVEKSLMLWLNYNIRSLKTACRERTAIITYSDLVTDSKEAVGAMQERLELPGISLDRLSSLIDPSLYRSRKSDTWVEETPIARLASQLYTLIESDKVSAEVVSEIECSYQSILDQLPQALISHMQRISRSEVHYRSLFYEAYNSFSWKASSPLRWIERKARGRRQASKPPRA